MTWSAVVIGVRGDLWSALHRIMTKQWRAWLKLQCSGMEWLTMLKMDDSAVVVTEAP